MCVRTCCYSSSHNGNHLTVSRHQSQCRGDEDTILLFFPQSPSENKSTTQHSNRLYLRAPANCSQSDASAPLFTHAPPKYKFNQLLYKCPEKALVAAPGGNRDLCCFLSPSFFIIMQIRSGLSEC